MLLSGVSAMADSTYSSGNQSVTISNSNEITVNDYNTVLIAKNTGSKMTPDDIVYVGQNNGGFTSETSFLLNNDAAVLTDGFYTIVLGNASDNTTKTANFFIGDASKYFWDTNTTELTAIKNNDDSVYEITDTEGNVTRAYVSANTLSLSNIKTIVVTYGNTTVYSSVGTELSDSADAEIGVKLSGIPKNTDVKVGISSKEATGLIIN